MEIEINIISKMSHYHKDKYQFFFSCKMWNKKGGESGIIRKGNRGYEYGQNTLDVCMEI
jgi:hypothetical protein